ncbi:MAG TPA: glycosyltransferase family 2 protein [Patescibacteria group bacterium]
MGKGSVKMDLSIVITSFNTENLLKECIESIVKHTKGIKYEVIVVDNASSDGSVAAAKRLKVKVIESKENLGFTKGNNLGIEAAKGKYILLLNSDTLISDNTLGEIISYMNANPRVGVATCALKNKDGSLQGTGGYFPTLIRVFSWMTIGDIPFVDLIIKPFHPMHEKSLFKGDGFYKKEKDLDWVTGAFLLGRREVFEQNKGLDEDYFMYGEDVDFCFKAKKRGWKVKYLPQFSITHYGGASSTREFPLLSEYKGIKIFYKKHYPSWQYPILRILLKIGSLGRMVVLGLLEGGESAKIYAKAFGQA